MVPSREDNKRVGRHRSTSKTRQSARCSMDMRKIDNGQNKQARIASSTSSRAGSPTSCHLESFAESCSSARARHSSSQLRGALAQTHMTARRPHCTSACAWVDPWTRCGVLNRGWAQRKDSKFGTMHPLYGLQWRRAGSTNRSAGCPRHELLLVDSNLTQRRRLRVSQGIVRQGRASGRSRSAPIVKTNS
jgi:hypothetical protein